MTLTPMEKRALKAFLKRKMVTMPFFIILIISLLMGGFHGFRWLKSKSWNQVQAEITLVTKDHNYQYEYSCKKEEKAGKGAVFQPKVFWYFPYGGDLQEKDKLAVAYNPDDPKEHIVLIKEESEVITWGILCIICFFLYCHLDLKMKRKNF